MDSDKKKKFKHSFKKYLKAGNEYKNCEEPCVKNGRSDRYCFDCANEMMSPIIEDFKNNNCKHDWEFVGAVGAAYCHLCNKWDDCDS